MNDSSPQKALADAANCYELDHRGEAYLRTLATLAGGNSLPLGTDATHTYYADSPAGATETDAAWTLYRQNLTTQAVTELPNLYPLPVPVAAVHTLTGFVADVEGSTNALYILARDAGGTVGIYAHVTAAADTPPTATRVIKVPIPSGASAANIMAAVVAAVDDDSKFSAALSGTTITITDSETGARAAWDADNWTGITATETVTGYATAAAAAAAITGWLAY